MSISTEGGARPVIPRDVKVWYVLACIAVLLQGGVSLLLGVLFWSQGQTFIGPFTLVWGIVMTILGVFVVTKARWALITAVVIYSLTVLLALVSNPLGAIIGGALFLTPMIMGIRSLSRMKKAEIEALARSKQAPSQILIMDPLALDLARGTLPSVGTAHAQTEPPPISPQNVPSAPVSTTPQRTVETVEPHQQESSDSNRKENTMGRILDTVLKSFQEEGWHTQDISSVPGQKVFRLNIGVEHGQYACNAVIEEEKNLYTFYTFYPEIVPVHRFHDVIEYLSRANWSLRIGNFDLNMSTGEVLYRTSIEFEDAVPTVREVKMLAYFSLLSADKFWPGLMELLHGNATPEVAFTHVQAATS